MNKKQYKDILDAGFTPCLDMATARYPKGVDLVLGKMLRFSLMSVGKCTATRARISRELSIDPSTFDTRVKILEADRVIIDETPNLRNHEHTYSVNLERILELINSIAKNSTVKKFPVRNGKTPHSVGKDSTVSMEDFHYQYGNSPHEETEDKERILTDSLTEDKEIDLPYHTFEECENVPEPESDDIYDEDEH